MTCNNKCIHFPVCEQKKEDFANIDECQYYQDNVINNTINNKWQTRIVDVKKYYAECPCCGFCFEMQSNRELPYFCGACGKKLRGAKE